MADTTVQMTQKIAKEHDIRLVPLHVTIDGRAYPENEIDLTWFYQQMPKWKENGLPTTSAPSAGDFLQAYRELSQKAEAVLDISLSSKFSATFSSAIHAKKMAENETPQVPFEIIDTFTACGAQMLIAIEAARAAAAGQSLPKVIEVANKMVKRVNYISLSDDISYLARGGRIHKGHIWAGAKVNSTVLLEATIATGGENRPLGRYRTKEQVLKALFEIVKERSSGKKLHVAINHADALAEAEELKEQVLSRFRCAEVYVTPILPLVTTHNGLGACKFSWWSED